MPKNVFHRRLEHIHQLLAKLVQATCETHYYLRLAKQLSKHAHQLFTFLEQISVESDDNRAERMALSPPIYATMHRVYDGVLQSPLIKGEEAIVLATGRENFDLIVGQDLITAYLGPDKMDHPFRVLETVLLRLKRLGSICAFSVK